MHRFTKSMCRAAAAAVLAGALGAGASAITPLPATAHGACQSPSERVTALVTSARVRCATAQGVAKAFDTVVAQGGEFPGNGRVRAQGFSCRVSAVGHESEESSAVRCTSGRNVVRFAWGV